MKKTTFRNKMSKISQVSEIQSGEMMLSWSRRQDTTEKEAKQKAHFELAGEARGCRWPTLHLGRWA